MCAKFGSWGWFSFSSAVNRHWQLLTAATKKMNGIFIYPLKMIPVLNFSSLGWFSFLSTVNSCWQLMTAVTQKNEWDFYLPPKADTCNKFQLSRLIFIFINCYQLSSGVDSCWLLMTADMKKNWLEFLCTHLGWYSCQISAFWVDFHFI